MLTRDAEHYTVHFDPDGALLEATLACEEDVFAERYGDDPAALHEAHQRYAASSTFLAVADPSGRVAAMARLVFPSAVGLETLVDIADEPWRADAAASFRQTGLDPARTWDLSSVGVRHAPRGQTALLGAAIYHGVIQALRANGAEGFVANLDVRVGRILNMLGLVLHPLPGVEPQPFWGSPASAPSYAWLDALLDHQRRAAPEAYRLVTLGVGLDGIQVPPLAAFTLRRPRPVVLPRAAQDAPVTVDLAGPELAAVSAAAGR